MPEFIFESWITRALIALLFLIIGWWAARKIETLTTRALTRMKLDLMLTRFIANLTRWTLITLVVLATLGTLGVRTTTFAAVIAAAGIAIALACQGVLASLAAGILLLALRPFKVGDTIRAAGETGTVVEVGLFTTLLNTPDNRHLTLQNKAVFGDNIENITFHPRRRIDIPIGIAYAADIDHTRAILEAAAQATPGALTDPAPAITLDAFGDSAVNWTVRLWTLTPDFGTTRQALIRQIKNALDQAAIGIPYPTMDVTLTRASAPPATQTHPSIIPSPTEA